MQGGGGVPDDLLTTKGDTHGFSDVNARIPVGSDNQILTSDSTDALGLAWKDPASGGLWEQAYQATISDNVFDTGSVTFKKYIHMYLSWSEFDLGGATNYKQELQFNSSSTAEYNNRYFCNANAGTRIDQTDLNIFDGCGTMTENSAGAIFISLINISGQPKYGLCQGSWYDASSSSGGQFCRSSVWFQWDNTSLVTSIQIDPDFGTAAYKYVDATLQINHTDG